MRRNVDGTIYANSMTPAVCKQVLAAFRVITGEDGTDIGACCVFFSLTSRE